MFTKFPASQTREERVALVRGAIDAKAHSAEELECEMCELFAHWGAVPVLARLTYDERFARQAGRPVPPITVYDAQEADFGAEPGPARRVHSQRVTGPALTQGLLPDLLEMIRIWKHCGIKLTPTLIDSLHHSHLTTIQEFLALGHWRQPENIEPNFRATAGAKDVDWKFTSGGIDVLLEVKFRRTDWRRGHPETVTFTLANLFSDIAEKFPLARKGLLRVAHVVLVQPADEELFAEAEKFATQPEIDALIVESLNVGSVEVVGSCAEQVRAMIGRGRTFRRPEVIPFAFARPSKREAGPQGSGGK